MDSFSLPERALVSASQCNALAIEVLQYLYGQFSAAPDKVPEVGGPYLSMGLDKSSKLFPRLADSITRDPRPLLYPHYGSASLEVGHHARDILFFKAEPGYLFRQGRPFAGT